MKKALAVLFSVLCALSVPGMTAAAANTVSVYVTIADDKGELALAQQKITVSDTDSDGVLTINDALRCAHDRYYDGGAAAGYKTSVTQYGLGITMLWGGGTASGFGYYVNNASAWSLRDAVKQGDYVYAFVYTDTDNWSDAYSFFDAETVTASAYTFFDVTLCSYEYDANWNLVKTPVKGARITVDGHRTSYVTDENGKASVAVGSGTHVISAVSDSLVLVPPVCTVTADSGNFLSFVIYIIKTIAAWFQGIFA